MELTLVTPLGLLLLLLLLLSPLLVVVVRVLFSDLPFEP